MKPLAIVAAVSIALTSLGVAPTFAQTRPAMVRSVDEPARVPFFQSVAPTCTFTNQCISTFAAVPAGKRLRITQISGFFLFTNVSGFVSFQVNNSTQHIFAFPVSPFNAAYYGSAISFNQAVDAFFESGQSPVLEFGIPAGQGGIYVDGRNRLTVSGYLVDVLP